MKRSLTQNRRLYQLFGNLNIKKDMKDSLVSQFTNGRTSASSEMEVEECQKLINTLSAIERNQRISRPTVPTNKGVCPLARTDNEQRQQMRTQVIKLMRSIGVIEGKWNSSIHLKTIQTWIKKRMGGLDKNFNNLDIPELTKFITILQTINRRYKEQTEQQAKLN